MSRIRRILALVLPCFALQICGYCEDSDILSYNDEPKINFNMDRVELGSDVISDEEKKKSQEIFLTVWDELSETYGVENMSFKSKMVFVNGAPGAGKGTNTRHIMRVLEVSNKPTEVSALLTTPEAEAVKASGKLVDDSLVIKLVFERLLSHKNEGNAVIIDGFPRTKIQAYALRMLIERMQLMEVNKRCVVMLLNLTVDHETSIDRQLARGRSALEHNKQVKETKEGEMWHVRETDISPEGAEIRWNTYVKETELAMAVLKDKLDYYEISTQGTFDEVRDRIHKTFDNRN